MRYCDGCQRDFPRSHLSYLYSKFESVEGHYCERCIHKAIKRRDAIVKELDEIYVHCGDCGDEYPRSHLYYIATYSGYYCERCTRRWFDEKEM